MYKISESEKKYIENGVECGIRSDGRGRLEYRPIVLETNVIPQASGSSFLKLGEMETQVLVGVKLELGEPSPEKPEQGKITTCIDWNASENSAMVNMLNYGAYISERSVQSSEVRNLEEQLKAELSLRLEKVIQESLDLNTLILVPGRNCWNVLIDCHILQNNGNVQDAVLLATRAALLSTYVPNLRIVQSEIEGKLEIELPEDPYDCSKLISDPTQVPLSITFNKIGEKNFYIADATIQEEFCSNLQLTVSVNSYGQFCGITKRGSSSLSPSSLKSMLNNARSIVLSLIKQQDDYLTLENSTRSSRGNNPIFLL
eukprot:TRINITY_DN1892_c3_g4_i1.p1 TRINITY_DN1892_c3_g4~~TRINITY_DN1892_c3_g4_i1.p1  ORF type:complete len:315 (-),score=103.06 TRINITY_DN1892_c3_g4_i1:93-1037(-)